MCLIGSDAAPDRCVTVKILATSFLTTLLLMGIHFKAENIIKLIMAYYMYRESLISWGKRVFPRIRTVLASLVVHIL